MNGCIVFRNTASSIEQRRQIADKLNIIATASSNCAPPSVLGKLIPLLTLPLINADEERNIKSLV